ncbi:MAG: hypothetical protein PHU14_05650 [Methylovulum sp.]|nr:hypothetical protein [Methylovulum sp.]
MAKHHQNFTSDQVDIFHRLSQEPTLEAANDADLDIGPELQGALNATIRNAKKYGYSRERIVERMNQCLPKIGKPITVRQLNAWTAHSKEFSEFPARWLPAFCRACNCTSAIRVLAQAVSHDLVDQRGQLALELGYGLVKKRALDRRTKQLALQLTGENA